MKFPSFPLTLFSAFLLASVAGFAADPASCYRIEAPDSPTASAMLQTRSEIWCYQNLSSPAGSTFIFNADSAKAKAELALIVEPDGVLTHGSLLAGHLTVHRIRSKAFNPFPMPLEEPRSLQPLLSAEVLTPDLLTSSQEVLNFLLSNSSQSIDLRMNEGHVEATVAPDLMPWRGYWWPYNGLPLSGTSSSPLAKYDRFVQARTGSNPGAQRWENTFHHYHGINWEGHCNGWAAASILRKEPAYAKVDARSGVVFSVVDQKGILAETDYCANVAFYGHRYNGGGDIRDIYPADFHNALTYYIGQLGKPVAMDYERGVSVDNHVISGYTMDIQKTGSNHYTVTAKLNVHRYDSSRVSQPGVAPEYTRTYRYTLVTDDSGTATGGSWISTNPDFLWVPLSPTTCNQNNPHMDEGYTADILDLPAAQ